ncbi:MAG: iron-sulfur cluster repair di-iron protein [Opitutaceae bacterium]|nr:iron-sulfur cluster repair di-iron protein [Opitutaceae bacterium]
MSHKPNVIFAAGTPLIDRTVGELVAERPGRSRVFQSFNIDFCCQGGRTLREACHLRGVAVEGVIEQLEAEMADPAAPASNPAELAPAELVDYIVEQHHGFLRRELPRLHTMAERVAHVHGGHTSSLVEIFQVFIGAESELTSHMMKEEQILFPAIVALSQGERLTGTLDGPISCMIDEHEAVGNALGRMRELSNGFEPPDEACNTYRALFAGLHDLEKDLHRHIHLENAVLFPAAQALVEQQN